MTPLTPEPTGAETLSREVLEKMRALDDKKRFEHIPRADPKRLVEADAIILGSPTRYGSATAQMCAFLDATGSLWSNRSLIGKIGAAFTSTASQHGGQETTILSLANFFLHQGMAFVGVPYSCKELLMIEETSGGTPYGASAIAGGRSERHVTENERCVARAQGRHVAHFAVRMNQERQA